MIVLIECMGDGNSGNKDEERKRKMKEGKEENRKKTKK
mgnify:CR=1 FL=1